MQRCNCLAKEKRRVSKTVEKARDLSLDPIDDGRKLKAPTEMFSCSYKNSCFNLCLRSDRLNGFYVPWC